MKAILVVLALFVFSGLLAEDVPAPTRKKEIFPAIPHAWISVEAGVLTAYEKRLGFANGPQALAASSYTATPLASPSFEWNPGLKINIGYQMTKWSFFLNWMVVQNRASGNRATDGASGFFPVLSFAPGLTASDYVTGASLNWRLNLNLIEAGASYPWEVGPFIFKPHAALRAAYLDQKLKAYYGGGFFSAGLDDVTLSTLFFGIGPAVGIMPTWRLGQGFTLVADLSSSALVGSFTVKQREDYLNQTLAQQTSHLGRICMTLDAKAALAWQKELFYKSVVVSAQLGWEWHEFFNQNQLPQSPFHLQSRNKSLFIQGAFLSLSVGF